MRIGYARVSTLDQNLDLQIDALQTAQCGRIYQEQASGKSTDREQLTECLKALRPDDTLVVWKLDRLGRRTREVVALIDDLSKQGIGFESLTDQIDTRSAAGQFILQVFAALAELERNLIRERTLAGLKAARARGRTGGRKFKLSPQEVRQIRVLLKNDQITVKEVAKRYGVARSTLYQALKPGYGRPAKSGQASKQRAHGKP
jgi:DNA invertase Pin-like site-specific DNA recombinase